MIRVKNEPKPTLELYLEDDGEGGVDLWAKFDYDTWHLANFEEGKPVRLSGGLPSNFPLALDAKDKSLAREVV